MAGLFKQRAENSEEKDKEDTKKNFSITRTKPKEKQLFKHTSTTLTSLKAEERAQAEAVFRLMIDSIIGLAILIIIISAISYFDQLATNQSISDFQQLVRSATQSPDGSVFGPKELTFPKGYTVTSSNLQSWTQKSNKCFNFETGSVTVKITNDIRADFLENLTVKVLSRCESIQCDPLDQTNENNCCVCCIISFGKSIDKSQQCSPHT